MKHSVDELPEGLVQRSLDRASADGGDAVAVDSAADADGCPDWGFGLVVAVVVVVAGWLLLLPISGGVQRIALNRFHLQSASFARWAAQAPVPAMYNFYNQGLVEPLPWDRTPWQQPFRWTMNHFPTRAFTFGDDRRQLCRSPRPMISLRSQYRGQQLQTRWLVDEDARGRLSISGEVVP